MSFLRRTAACWVFAAGLLPSLSAWAADPEFVGVLALAAEPEVADQLGLTPETREKLAKLILDREDAVAAVVLEAGRLPLAERTAKLQPFVAETENLGLALLTLGQRAKLEQIRLGKLGTGALIDAGIAGKIGLTETQQAKLAELATQMKLELAPAAERERMLIRGKYERDMLATLDKTQRAAWEQLTGVGGAAAPPTDAPVKEAPAAKPLPSNVPADLPSDEPTSEPKDEPKSAKPVKPAVEPKDTPRDNPADDSMPPAKEPAAISPKPLPPEKEEPFPGEANPTQPVPTKPAPPAVVRPSEPVAAKPPINRDNLKLKFNFQHAPWKSVLEWFAEQSDLSLVMDTPPTGTFNYKDQRSYTPAEAIDLLNGILQTKGFTLVRRNRMLMLINLEDGLVDGLVSDVLPEELDKRGEYEVVRCLFTLVKMTPEDAEGEIRKLLGATGKLVVLPKSKQIYVTETAGKLRTVRRVIEAVENPAVVADHDKVTVLNLQYVTPAEFLQLAAAAGRIAGCDQQRARRFAPHVGR